MVRPWRRISLADPVRGASAPARLLNDLSPIALKRRAGRFLGRNLRLSREELDLVAVDPGPPGALVLIEVRSRGTREFGLPEETFDHRKRRHLWTAAMRLLEVGQLPGGMAVPRLPIRVDLVVVEPPARPGSQPRIRHHRDALAI